MAAYLKFGTKIKGESEAEGHKGSDGWIEINSLQFGAGRGISTPVGTSSKREASAPSISEVTVTKSMDSTSTALFNEACVGTAQDCEIHLVETGADKLETFLEVKLTNAMISGYSASSGGDRPSESLSINFTKVELRYIPFNDDHTAGTPVTAGYDLTAGKKV